jgi:cell fate (sporulation/competence/biofilm development) regulator YlbF (YheA/YmcA/DUF963 family)
MQLRKLSIFGPMALLCLAVLSVPAMAQKKHPHHNLHHALWELRDARHELKETKHDFGEHKEKAILAINEAIRQIEICLKNVGDNGKGEPTRRDLKDEYKKYKHHPHLHHAVVELRHAHKELKETRHNFGGHKDAALRDINAAIFNIEALLKHDRK